MKIRFCGYMGVRGVAIIAVVVCHQYLYLHSSQWVQMPTIFSVSSLIFMMGVTKVFSIKKCMISHISIWEMTKEALKSLVFPYIFVSMFYLESRGEFGYTVLWERILSFNASPPLYFVAYAIIFTMLSPFLFLIVEAIFCSSTGVKRGLYFFLLFLGLVFLGVKVSFLGNTYLVVYAMGMAICYRGFYKISRWTKILSALLLVVAFFMAADCFFSVVYEGRTLVFNIGLDSLIPNTINPPNFTVILYSLACINFLYNFFYDAENSIYKHVYRLICVLGKYSLDIFLWHTLIQQMFAWYVFIPDIWMKRIILYTAMFTLPIIGRKTWNYVIKRINDLGKMRGTEN